MSMILFLLATANGMAQQDTARKVDVNFLFNYYEQDGNHSAVTGGTGTQKLGDKAGKIQLIVDMDTVNTLTTSLSLNRYTSASTDRIDSRLSSASAEDYHLELQVDYDKKKNDSLSVGGSFFSSVESDYISMGLGYHLRRKKVKNGTYTMRLNGFYDSYILIYPEELRNADFRMAPTDKRYTLNLSQSYNWFMSKRINAGITLDLTWQNGMLGTPFHRVYFKDTSAVSIEQLPENRFKVPLGFQINYFASDYLILKGRARLYTDDFGIQAMTLEAQPVFLLSNYLSLSPFYRFHSQSAAKFFNPYAENSFEDLYYTSDYDLAALKTHKYGVQMKYKPLYGVLGKDKLGWKSVGLRYSKYSRSDGLEASTLSFAFGFVW